MQDSISRLSDLDWDFHGDKSDSPFSDLHFHPGRFVPQIPAALIGSLTSPGDRVVDPFCGSGTTLVEAQRLGRLGVGIDLNPVSCLVSRSKTLTLLADQVSKLLLGSLDRLTSFRLENASTVSNLEEVPAGVQLEKWYHPETGEQLRVIWAFINAQVDLTERELLTFCFSAALMTCCAETRSWGYVCDNTQPLESRYVDAMSTFREKVESVIDAYQRRDRRWLVSDAQTLKPVLVLEGDAYARLREIPDNSVDLIVTSPPYFGVIDYVKSQRLTLEWLSLKTEPLRLLETGARSSRHRRAAFSEYSNALELVVSELHRVLKPSKTFAMVIGESAKRESVMDRLNQLLEKAGFHVDLTINRKIGLRRRQVASLDNEWLILAKKI